MEYLEKLVVEVVSQGIWVMVEEYLEMLVGVMEEEEGVVGDHYLPEFAPYIGKFQTRNLVDCENSCLIMSYHHLKEAKVESLAILVVVVVSQETLVVVVAFQEILETEEN